MSLSERKLDLVWHMFIDPADGNYLAARWAYDNGLFHQFYWDAAQCVEKLLKATLLLNDCSVKDHKHHQLVELFNAFLTIDADKIFPEIIQMPETTGMGKDAWQGEPYSLFIEYLNRYGSADNRYGSIGTFVNGPVIHLLDRCCHDLRTFMRHKNFFGKDLYELNNENQYEDDTVAAPQDWMISPDFLLERLYLNRYEAGQDERLRRVFSNRNLSFFKERSADESTFGGIHMMGSPLHNHLVRLLDQNDRVQLQLSKEQKAKNREIVLQLKEWAGRTLVLNKQLQDQLNLN